MVCENETRPFHLVLGKSCPPPPDIYNLETLLDGSCSGRPQIMHVVSTFGLLARAQRSRTQALKENHTMTQFLAGSVICA